MRLYAFSHTYVINPDGANYLYQAKAFSEGMWKESVSCGYTFISLYPLFIAASHKIFSDWITAAKVVSLFFGVITVIPFYFLMKRFFSPSVTGISTLIFALNPVLVERSVDLIKGPVFWFFAVLGILLFVKAMDKKNGMLYLCSSIVFFIASLARIESLLLFGGSLLFLVFSSKRSVKDIIFFSVPLIAILITLAGSFFVSENGLSIWHLYIEPRFTSMSENILHNLFDSMMTGKLRELDSQQLEHIPGGFFIRIKNMLWFIALGFLLMDTINAFYLPFFIIFILGLALYRKSAEREPLTGYFLLLSVIPLVFIYLFLIGTWFIERRYLAPVLFPAFFFVGLGIQKLISYLKLKGIREKLIVPAICVLTFFVTLPENLESERKDILAFREIGEVIAHEVSEEGARIATSEKRIITYANLLSANAVCPNPVIEYRNLMQEGYPEMISLLRENNMDYFVWEEAKWQKTSFDCLKEFKSEELTEKGQWEIKGEKLVLFKVTAR